MKCCICGQNLEGQPAMVDRATGEAFCSRDSHYFGLHPSNRPQRATVHESKHDIEPATPLLWETPLKDGGDHGNRLGPVNFGDTLIVAVGSCLHALSLRGSINWTYFPSDGLTCPNLPEACNDLIVFVTLSDKVQAVELQTGKLRWECEPGGDLQGQRPASDGVLIYISNREGYVYALDANDGKVVWSHKQPDRLSPLVIANRCLFASGRNSVVAIDAPSGKERWSAPINHAVREAVAVVGNIAYVSTATKVVALTADLGTLLWDYEFRDDRPIQYCHASRPIVADRQIFIRRNDHSVSCVDLERHELDWRYTVPLEETEHYPYEPVVAEGIVFCEMGDSHLHAIDAASGIALWHRPSKAIDKPFVNHGILYFLENRRLCALSIK